ncbi:MAG: hypothetical protein WDM96_13785 [Lacunisphaera sp.]
MPFSASPNPPAFPPSLLASAAPTSLSPKPTFSAARISSISSTPPPDLAGLDIDVGRYIRDGEERDVQVYWRTLAPDAPPSDDIAPQREELVRVSLYSSSGFKKFAEKNKTGIWLWSVLDGEWQRLRPERLAPRPDLSNRLHPRRLFHRPRLDRREIQGIVPSPHDRRPSDSDRTRWPGQRRRKSAPAPAAEPWQSIETHTTPRPCRR